MPLDPLAQQFEAAAVAVLLVFDTGALAGLDLLLVKRQAPPSKAEVVARFWCIGWIATRYDVPPMPAPSCTLSRIQMRLSHLLDTEPGQPPTTSRTGKP